ncbi:MAG: DUF4199 domain-containing protein [Erythrobacter sp.]
MLRYSFTYGAIIGVVIIGFMVATLMVLGTDNLAVSEVAGYAVMLAVLALLFMGIKRYRDVEHGGVIGFRQAAGVGIGIAAVAAVFYAISWEIVLYATDYAFMQSFGDSMRAAIEAKDLAAAERAAELADLEESMAMYANPLFRVPVTFLEIFPVALVVALISAFVLKNPKVLPARASA